MENILSTELIDNQQLRPSEYYGYIYLTINLINNKAYVGAHKSKVFDRKYKGSGKILWRAIEKYGWDNFESVILEWCSSKKELYNEEARIIKLLNCVESSMYYNIMPGGHGGDNKSSLTEDEYQEYRKRVSISKKDRPRTSKELEHLNKLHSNRIGTHLSDSSKMKSRISNLGQTRTEEARLHMSKNHADFSGSKNPFYGKSHSYETRKKISDNNAKAHKGKVWITNKRDHEILIRYEDIDKYPEYVRGRLRKRQKVKFND